MSEHARADEDHDERAWPGAVLVLVIVFVLAVGAAVLAGVPDRVGDVAPSPTPTSSSSPASTTSPTMASTPEGTNRDEQPTQGEDEVAAPRLAQLRGLLTDPDLAYAAPRAELDASVAWATHSGDWVLDEWGELDPAEDEVGRETPLVVGRASVDGDGTTTFDVVWSIPRSFVVDTLTFRVLGADARLVDADFRLARVVVDGRSLSPDTVLDRTAAQLVIGGSDQGEGDVRVRLVGRYVVPERSSLPATEDPVGYGLLARSGDLTALGHWLPVPTFDPGPFADTGADIGAFPAATWSVEVAHPGVLVSGGNEGPCVPAASTRDGDDVAAAACTWLRARNLRDLSAVVVPPADRDNPSRELDRDGARVGRVELHGDDRSAIVDEAAATLPLFRDLFGPLPWGELDVVAVPLRPAAAGMEFPGMVWVDPGVLAADAGFGSYVLAHEVAHQWFHGLLGSGSLTDPVIDESLAQYGSYLAVREQHGQAAADGLDAAYVTGRHQRGIDRGDDEDPAMPVAGFRSDASYGSAVYGRAGAAWIDADRDLGSDRVTGAIAEVVAAFRLDAVSTGEFLAALTTADPELGRRIADAWGAAPA